MAVLFRFQYNNLLSVCVILVLSVVRSAKNENITISLNKTLTLLDKELYGGLVTITKNSTLQVNLENNFDKKIDFIIFQVHSHIYNITLYNNTYIRQSYISGTNVGLYSPVKPVLDTYYILNKHQVDLKLYISVHGYRKMDPIPGGCNLDFPINVSPFMQITYNKSLIKVCAPLAQDRSSNPNCSQLGDNNGVRMIFYKMYLPETTYDNESYFEGVKKMLTLKNIKENGDEVPDAHFPNHVLSKLRRLSSAYPGIGVVYVAVAYKISNENMYSVYVPTYTYACSPLDGDCDIFDDFVSQIFCAALIFIGLFTCYFGHRFFKTEMFLVGMFAGVILSYILISIIIQPADGSQAAIDHSNLMVASLVSGVFFGAIWLLFWWFYGIPILAVLMVTLHVGFILSSIVYYRVPPGSAIIQHNSTFWILFIAIMILTSCTLISATFLSNLFCCSLLGAYAAVFAVDHYMGSSLKYIVINTVRRAVIKDFNYADLSPPFQWRDILVTLLWVALAVSGFLFQHYHNRGRPPFPPPPRSISPRMPELYYPGGNRTRRLFTIERGTDIATNPNDERAPLLANENPRYTM